MVSPQRLIAWLQYLDMEYLDQTTREALSKLDINDSKDQEEIVRLAMEREMNTLNEVSRISMRNILEELKSYPEHEVRKVLSRVGMPFKSPLVDYLSFFEKVRQKFFERRDEGPAR